MYINSHLITSLHSARTSGALQSPKFDDLGSIVVIVDHNKVIRAEKKKNRVCEICTNSKKPLPRFEPWTSRGAGRDGKHNTTLLSSAKVLLK